ncbi:MAG: Glycosyl transferase family protein [Candidatus Amesbacteria bacterium GW2011_GWB1_47_26]|uniref:Glycosyl transferase family protein n=1 Tax=Candidatus Amesbacteria bacterium GW2011_GWC2_45_19 TaxID=1618366 RepID=A0A0G1M5Y7_9BACT|nr:MAG: Glycosyl transferase family protein [Candidatus Amesbacteria bacterium GW2011_GWC2_45_19]KKU38447.1 MAG: Glycosyl transferase family protein [Candidatus Amesbacteria bacterium GW2011_GWA1_46_35]KKU69475.1 MAG: Glycosyl transferase family protein [Microgenomates group bacterium GW2011_GWC1_47_20]KKU75189.1 MAG: Glycosyl transferase family protein [Candidatus Amesbacteria bacterium GW2011_GWB1_47_26]
MNDPVGAKTLDIMAGAKNYNRWLFGQIRPWLVSPVAEVGAGTGTFVQMMSDLGLAVTAVDYNPQYLKVIQKNHSGISTLEMNLEKPWPAALRNKFSSVISLNVIEHITDDFQALANIFAMLRPSGRAVILVPAHGWAYGTLDKNLGHVRRYDAKSLTKLLESAGFTVTCVRYLNILGLIGWWVNGVLFRKPTIPTSQLRFFDFISPSFFSLEKYISLPIGLSLLAVARKP